MLMRQEMQCVSGGITDSIFPKTENYMYSRSSHQKRLSSLYASEKYESLMDMFFCIVFPEYKPTCFKFYEDRNLPLRKLLSREKVSLYDEILFLNLKSIRNKEEWEVLSDIGIC